MVEAASGLSQADGNSAKAVPKSNGSATPDLAASHQYGVLKSGREVADQLSQLKEACKVLGLSLDVTLKDSQG